MIQSIKRFGKNINQIASGLLVSNEQQRKTRSLLQNSISKNVEVIDNMQVFLLETTTKNTEVMDVIKALTHSILALHRQLTEDGSLTTKAMADNLDATLNLTEKIEAERGMYTEVKTLMADALKFNVDLKKELAEAQENEKPTAQDNIY